MIKNFKKISVGFGTLISTAIVPITMVSCGENETTYINKTFNSISEAQRKIKSDSSILMTNHGVVVFNKNLNITIHNNKFNMNFKIKKGESRDKWNTYLQKGLIQVAQPVKNDIDVLSFLNSNYLWNVEVLSRTPKNGPININNPMLRKAPYIIAANISKWTNPGNVRIDFELSNGDMLFGVYDFTKGLELHSHFSEMKWNKFPWTQQPNNKMKLIKDILANK